MHFSQIIATAVPVSAFTSSQAEPPRPSESISFKGPPHIWNSTETGVFHPSESGSPPAPHPWNATSTKFEDHSGQFPKSTATGAGSLGAPHVLKATETDVFPPKETVHPEHQAGRTNFTAPEFEHQSSQFVKRAEDSTTDTATAGLADTVASMAGDVTSAVAGAADTVASGAGSVATAAASGAESLATGATSAAVSLATDATSGAESVTSAVGAGASSVVEETASEEDSDSTTAALAGLLGSSTMQTSTTDSSGSTESDGSSSAADSSTAEVSSSSAAAAAAAYASSGLAAALAVLALI